MIKHNLSKSFPFDSSPPSNHQSEHSQTASVEVVELEELSEEVRDRASRRRNASAIATPSPDALKLC